jgi:hypothetical protein
MPQARTEKLITIRSIGEKGSKFWIKDTEDEFYSGFTEYQGTPNSEYQMLKNGNHNDAFQEGDQALIEYTKTAGTDKEGNDVIYKNIKGIYPADTSPKSSRTQSPRTEANRGQSARSTEDSIIRQVAFKGAIEMAVAGKIDLVAIEKYTNAFERIIQGHSSPASEPQEELPTIQRDDEPPVDSFEEPPLSDSEIESVPF